MIRGSVRVYWLGVPQTPNISRVRLRRDWAQESCSREFTLQPTDVPEWVSDLVDATCGAPRRRLIACSVRREVCATVETFTSSDITLVSIVLPNVTSLNGQEMQAAAADLYKAVQAELADAQSQHPVRIWNFIPGISDSTAPGLDRYMSFNLGRFDGISSWLGMQPDFRTVLPTATGVGHPGSDLAVHVLAAATPGTPIENPRQRPAYTYSSRFGPKPPCFARATIARVRGRTRLLIGGTASVIGEDSVHVGAINAQVSETLTNLEAVVQAARSHTRDTSMRGLQNIVEARVYCSRRDSIESVDHQLKQSLPSVRRLEVRHAELCRPELLVEVEAVADLEPCASLGNGPR